MWVVGWGVWKGKCEGEVGGRVGVGGGRGRSFVRTLRFLGVQNHCADACCARLLVVGAVFGLTERVSVEKTPMRTHVRQCGSLVLLGSGRPFLHFLHSPRSPEDGSLSMREGETEPLCGAP